jgi:competence protein ComEC
LVLIGLSCAWLVGILVGWYHDVSCLYCLIGIAPLAWLFFIRRHRKIVFIVSLVIFVLPLAAAYSYSQLNVYDESDLRFYNDRGQMQLRGVISQAPDVRDNSTRLTVSVSEIDIDNNRCEVTGEILVFLPRYPAREYGDFINITGEPETPSPIGDFDYRGYLAGQGIYTVMFYPEIEVLDNGRGNPALAGIYSLRNNLADSFGRILPEPQASLAQGVILGIRGNISSDVTDDFSRSGVSHLLAISGLHLGIIAGVMLGIGLWLFGRRHYLYVWLALAAVWFFAVITGFHLPVVRGAIMASLFLFAEMLGRQRSAIVALVFAAAVMVGIWPYILGNASFQLSFLAMAGLVFIFPIIRDFGRRITSRFLGGEGFIVATANASVDILAATLGAVLAVWPVVAYYFGIVSLVGPLATFLALPALPGAIVLGALAAVLGLFVMPLAQVFGWLAWLFLSYILAVASGLAAPSGAVVELDSVSPILIWIYYPVLGFLLWLYHQKSRATDDQPTATPKRPIRVSFPLSRRLKWVMVTLLVMAVLVTGMAFTLPDARLHVSFLDVGEGDAILVRMGSRQVLIDGGPGRQAVSVELGKKMPFWDRSIDLVILTHPHQDHLGGLVDVLRDFRVDKVVFVDSAYRSPLYTEWLELLDEKAIETVDVRTGWRVELSDGVVLEVLSPPDELFSGTDSDTDNNSIVARLCYGEVSFLLCGDIMREAETELAFSRADLASTVLKVPHHGSDTSTIPEFLAVVDPQVAVISAGIDNKFGHPDAAVVERLARRVGTDNIYQTTLDGTIEFVTDGSRLWVATEK